MAVIQFLTDNVADGAVITGGVFQPSLPVTNLQQPNLAYVARTVDAATTSTRIDIDLGNASTVVRAIGVMRHSCSTSATHRVTAGTSPGASDAYDSGNLPVWPRVYDYMDLPYGAPNWWTGQISAAEAANYPLKLLHDTGANYLARYWRLQVTDTANPAGYVQFARLVMGELWSPRRTYSYGAGLMWEPRDRAELSRSGVRYAERRPAARVFSFSLGALDLGEGFGRVLDAQRTLGSEGELLVIPNTDDLQRRHRRDIWGRLRRIEPLVNFAPRLQSVQLEVEELL